MGDAVNGKKLFIKMCASCHTTEMGGKHKRGPNLHDIIGRTCGTVPEFKFSEIMKEKAVVWNEKTLHDYLEFPNKFVPETHKTFHAIKKVEDRNDMIAFLATLKSN